MGLQVNLMLPLEEDWGSRRERTGQFSNTPPTAFCLSPPCVNTGDSCEGCEGEWGSR